MREHTEKSARAAIEALSGEAEAYGLMALEEERLAEAFDRAEGLIEAHQYTAAVVYFRGAFNSVFGPGGDNG